MAEVDKLMIEAYGITLIQMMENAGRNLARLAGSRFLKINQREQYAKPPAEKHSKTQKVAVLAGTGGNGGGALVCSRYLFNYGYRVEVFLTKPEDEYSGVPKHQLNILKKMDIPIRKAEDLNSAIEASLIIDGIIGYSLKGKPRGPAADMIVRANSLNIPVLSLDIPSGLDPTFGKVLEPVITADATMTLALPKKGLAEKNAEHLVGELYLADIGVPPGLYSKLSIKVSSTVFKENDIILIR